MESSVGKKQRSRVKYKALLGVSDVLDNSAAIIQAAHVLDLAGDLAAKNEDIDSLKTLSKGWLDIAKMLTSETTEDEDDSSREKSYGFRGGRPIIEKSNQEVSVENGEQAGESSSKSGIYVKYG